jgi:hypothetical protein
MYNGDISKIDNHDYVDINGYFAGTFKSQNAFGAELEGYLFIGNSYKMVQKYRSYN